MTTVSAKDREESLAVVEVLRVKRKRSLPVHTPENLYVHQSGSRYDAKEDINLDDLNVRNGGEPSSSCYASQRRKRPKKYSKVMTVSWTEMVKITADDPSAFTRKITHDASPSSSSVVVKQEDAMKNCYYSVATRRQDASHALETHYENNDDPLKQTKRYKICDLECGSHSEYNKVARDGDDDEHLYDLYIAEEEQPEEEEEERQHKVEYDHQHTLILYDEDFFIPEEDDDHTDSCLYDTEDSNAEDYYANDYPDEDEWGLTHSEDEDDENRFRGYDAMLEQRFGGFYDDWHSSDDSYQSSMD